MTRSNIISSLNKGFPCMLMPGGVVEALMNSCCSTKDEVLSVSGHTGFLQIALEQKTKVVPCFAFGLDRQHRDWLPRLTLFTYKYFNFPFPAICLNDHNFPGRNTVEALTLVIGKAIDTTQFTTMEDLSTAFRASLQDLYTRHKLKDPRYATKALTFLPKKDSWEISKQQYRFGRVGMMLGYCALVLFSLLRHEEYPGYRYILQYMFPKPVLYVSNLLHWHAIS